MLVHPVLVLDGPTSEEDIVALASSIHIVTLGGLSGMQAEH